MKRFLTLLAFVVATISSYAYDCEVDGIYYDLFGSAAIVTYGSNKYTGSVVIPEKITYNGNTYSVKYIEVSAFSYCTSLTSVTIPNSVTWIGSGAFGHCSGLTSITIPNSVTYIDIHAFEYCSGLTSIVVEQGNLKYDNRDNCNAIIETSTNELIIGCANTIIPNSVTSIGEYAFCGCSGLTSVTIPNSVTSIGLKAFYNCSGLTSVTIPYSVTSIGDSAFAFCSGLTTLMVEDGNACYCSMDNVIFNKDKKELIVCAPGKQGVYTIPNSVTSIGIAAFEDCSGLTSVTIPNSVTSIGISAFYGCSGLTSITIPNSVSSIGGSTFGRCSGLTSVTIPNSVTSIGNSAFMNCSGLTSITIPNSVTSIGSSAFDCRSLNLNTVYCYAEDVPATEHNNVFGYSNENLTLYVPSGSIDAYKSTEPWSQFGTIIPMDIPKNNLTLESVYADKNSEDITLSVGLDNETQFTSVMFDLYLPEGVTALKDDLGYYMELNNTRCNSRGGFTLEGEEQADGAVRVMLYSSRGTMIYGDSGELFTITLKTAGNVAAGNHKFEVKRVICAVDVTAEGRYELKNADGYIRVKGDEQIELYVPVGGYATLCLPYEASLPYGLRAFKATGVKDGVVELEELQAIPACTPLIVKGPEWHSFYFYGDNSAADKFEYSVGSLKSSLISTASKQGYVLQNLANGLGFYKIKNKLTVPAFRCVLDEAAASAAPAFVPVSFDEDANAIEATGYKLQTTDSSVYTIDGKRVETMEKGKIYIVNGVKMMVK